jgi:hypothetical protein
VADIPALDQVDHVLGDVLGVVADPLDRLDDEHRLGRYRQQRGPLCNPVVDGAQRVLVLEVEQLVALGDLDGEIGIALAQRLQRALQRRLGRLHHAGEAAAVDLHRIHFVQDHAARDLRDLLRLVADPLQLGEALQRDDDDPEVDAHRLPLGDQLDGGLFAARVEGIEVLLTGDNLLGQIVIALQQGAGRVLHLADGEFAHLDQHLGQLGEILVETVDGMSGVQFGHVRGLLD